MQFITVEAAETGVDATEDVDAIEEIRLRTWARTNYSPSEERDDNWHPIVLDEMHRKDRELNC